MPEKQKYRRFFRIVQTNPPTTHDFRSNKELGRPLLNPKAERLWDGISVWERVGQARSRAKGGRPPGAFIAELRVPVGGSVRIEKTTRRPGHYTLWADASWLLKLVSGVVRV